MSTYCSKKSLAKVNLARGVFHFMILIIYTISLGVNKETKKSVEVGAVGLKVYDRLPTLYIQGSLVSRLVAGLLILMIC